MHRQSFPISFISVFLTTLFFTGCSDGIDIPNGLAKTYVKIDKHGNTLANQNKAWNFNDATASETNSDRWSCLLDESTGIMWELKAWDGSFRDYRYRYSWYNSDPSTNGGEHGIGDLGYAQATPYQFDSSIGSLGSDFCVDQSRCDTEKYIADVNAKNLCGHNDWRLPTRNELISVVYGKDGDLLPIRLDTKYFVDATYYQQLVDSGWYESNPNNTPYTYFPSSTFWTSETKLNRIPDAYMVSFTDGYSFYERKHTHNSVRLVRDN